MQKATELSGIELIAAERRRQIEQENWTLEHDDAHRNQELAAAAICYASPFAELRAKSLINGEFICDPWPWDDEWDKRQKHDRLRQLVIAGALIAAEIDRLKRKGAPDGSKT